MRDGGGRESTGRFVSPTHKESENREGGGVGGRACELGVGEGMQVIPSHRISVIELWGHTLDHAVTWLP